MSCRELERYESGELDETEFVRHAAGCPSCREILRQDAEIMAQAKELRRPVQAPGLWSRIEKALEEEAAKETGRAPLLARFLRLAPTAALMLAAAGLAVFFVWRRQAPAFPSGLLAREALVRVEKEEKEYLEAIENLEKQALPRIADLNLELNFLYKERLETIDSQIEQCRDALASNPANAHIRRYLIIALQDKKETLAKVLSLRQEKSEGT